VLALAWVLNQAFPTWAVVGVRSVAELDECVGAADLALDPGQVRWLASGDDGGG
jgi:aryl-alcohol dehydrogenase-like predicted oxidoreductase